MAVRWGPVSVLGAAQFVMVLDSTVMNVSLSTVVADLHTTIAAMQTTITFYTLVMSAFMLLGAKLGDVWGRRRTLVIGCLVYALGSAITAVSPNIVVLFLGWSIVEGLGAVLVIPSIAALIADNYGGRARVSAFAVIGAASGAGAAAGPLIGGFLTTYASWRYVFASEVIVMAIVLLFSRVVHDRGMRVRPHIDILSVALSALGLVSIVFGLLQTKAWGWVLPASDLAVLGLSPVPFLAALGVLLLWLFFRRQQRLSSAGRPPLLDVRILGIRRLRAGVGSLGIQYAVTAGMFFIVPVYLQLTLGLDALTTGLRILPLSAALVLFSAIGTALTRWMSPKRIARTGQLALVVASLVLLGAVDPELNNWLFGSGMFAAGAALGLLASQLGNVTMSAVDERALSEAGGVQGVFQNLGSSLGTALIGSVMIAALATQFAAAVASSDLPPAIRSQVAAAGRAGVGVVPVAAVPSIAQQAGLDQQQGDELARLYSDSQLASLRLSFAALTAVSLGALFFSRNLPTEVLGRTRDSGLPDGDPLASYPGHPLAHPLAPTEPPSPGEAAASP